MIISNMCIHMYSLEFGKECSEFLDIYIRMGKRTLKIPNIRLKENLLYLERLYYFKNKMFLVLI